MKKFYSDIQALCGLTVSGTTTLSTATGVTRTTSDNSTHLATTAFVKNQGYITAAALAGYVPTSRTLTINGISYDLTANRSWTISSADGYISNVQLNGNSLDFTGQGSAFSGSIDLSAIVPTVRTVYERVKNTSGAIIYKGTPLAVVPGQTSGNISDVIPADAADPAKMPAVFIANETMADQAEGEAVAFGSITGIDTSLYQSGTTVYVAPGGGWTATKPVHPNLIQNLGVITKQHATNGGGVVTGVGRANALPNLTDGKIWVGTANYPIESSTVHIDETNNRVGIAGITNPDSSLVVFNNITARLASGKGIHFGNSYGELGIFGASDTGSHYNPDRITLSAGNRNPSNSAYIDIYSRYGATTGTRGDIILNAGYYPADNNYGEVSVITGAATRLTVDVNGNVGIGTTSPTTKLHVTGVTQIAESGNTAFYGGNYVRVFNDQNFNFRNVSGTTVANISVNGSSYFNGGNVGIGTTSPLSKLHLSDTTGGSIYMQDSDGATTHNISSISNNGNNFGIYTRSSNGTYVATDYQAVKNSSGTDYHRWFTNGDNERLRITSSGNVGIGTTSPSQKLEVIGPDASGATIKWQNANRIAGYLYSDGGGAGFYVNSLANTGIYFFDSSRIDFRVGGSERVRITSDGNVGIGTSSPLSKLQVRAGLDQNFRVISGTNLTVASINDADTAYAPITFRASTFDFQNGNVGIGTTTPAYKLHTVGTFGLQAAGTGTNENFKILDGSAGTIMQVLDNGNVGIGGNAETSASYKLRVHGGIWANSFEQLYTLNGTAGVGRIEYYNTGGSHRTLGFRTYGPHAAESVKGFIEISSQVLTYSGMGNIVLHADADFADHPTLVLRSLNTAADSFYMQNYHHDLGALFITKATTGGDDSMRFRPGRTSDVLVVNTGGIEITGSIVKTGGTSSQFLKADGSVDSNSYSTTSHNHDSTYVNVTGDTMTGNLSIKGTSATLTLSKTDDDQYLKFVGGTGGANQLIQTSYNLGIDTGGAGSRTMTLLSSGNVGIGTANPSKQLHIYTSGNEGIFMQGTTGGVWMDMQSSGGEIQSIGAQNSGFGVYNRTQGVYRLFIANNGNLGIGTTSPAYKLDVAGEARINQYLYLGADVSIYRDGANILRTDDAFHANGNIHVGSTGHIYNRANTASYIKFTSPDISMMGGKVGVGTITPAETFHVEGSGMVLRSASYLDSGFTISDDIYDYRIGTVPPQLRTNYIHIQRNGSNTLFHHSIGAFKWVNSGAEKMQLSNAGDLGIATTAPAEKLHVVGNVRIEGSSTSVTLETTDKAAVPTGAIIASYPVASTYGALIDYVIYDTNRDNMRVGTMRAVWNNGDAVYNDVSTVDIGNTDPVILSAVINGTNVDLVVTGDITFTIKASIKVIR